MDYLTNGAESRLRERIYGYQGEGWWVGVDWEIGIDMYTLLYLK